MARVEDMELASPTKSGKGRVDHRALAMQIRGREEGTALRIAETGRRTTPCVLLATRVHFLLDNDLPFSASRRPTELRGYFATAT